MQKISFWGSIASIIGLLIAVHSFKNSEKISTTTNTLTGGSVQITENSGETKVNIEQK